MTWKKGQSGNPKGLSVEKLVKKALLMEVAGKDGFKRLRKIADAALSAAEAGDAAARTWVSERLDGKVPQPVSGPDGEGAVTVVVKNIVRSLPPGEVAV